MTALAIGSSVTALVRDGGTVAVATNGGLGSVTRTAVGGTTATINFGPEPTRRIFGPYSEGASVSITNISCNAFDYDPQTTDAASDFLGAFAWLGLPDAASYAGYRARVTDYGVNLMVISDGTRWVPNGVQTLGRSAAPSSVTGTASETPLATVTVPAGLLGLNGGVRITSSWTVPNNANTKTLRGHFGGIAGTVYLGIGLTTFVSYSDVRVIRNRNSVASQVGSYAAAAGNAFGSNGGSLPTGAIDTTQNQDIVLTGILGVTTDTITLEQYTVEVLP